MAKTRKTKGERSWNLAQDLGEYCDDTGTPDPGRFLAEIMGGQDPRPGSTSKLWELINKFRNEDIPDEYTWGEIKSLVLSDDRYRRNFVDIDQSIKAAERLAEYMYAKRKAVEVSGHISASVAVTRPLTIEEIELFEEHFCGEF